MKVDFYINQKENCEYPKIPGNGLIQKITLNGSVRDENLDLVSPTLSFKNTDILRKKNYAYIEDLGRYYYVTDISIDRTGIATVSFRVDALNSFWDEVSQNDALLLRSENYGNFYMSDSELPVQQDTIITYAKTYSSPFSGFSIVLNALNTSHSTNTNSVGN